MTTKLTLTLSIDADMVHPDDYERKMEETLKLLTANGIGPTNKITFALAFEDEDEALEMRNEIKTTLGGRPDGIDAEIKAETKEGVQRVRVATVTPMDRIQGFADKHDAKVTLVAGGRSVDLTPETAQNAARMIRESLQ